ncbi:MAG: hypothetical protein WCL54_00025 [Clostridia bacterium]
MKRIIFLVVVLSILGFGFTQFRSIEQFFTPVNLNQTKFDLAKDSARLGKFHEAITVLNEIPADALPDVATYKANLLQTWRTKVMTRVDSLIKSKKYAQSAKELLPLLPEFPADETLIKLNNTCIAFSKPVVYNGPIEHIFFHPLMTYEKVQKSMKKGFDEYMVTIDEFSRTLEQFYKANYVLIDIHSIYGTKKNGDVFRKTLIIPKGKKPLVLSIDDYNFLTYMKQNGCAQGLGIVNGKVLSYVRDANGKKIYSADKEVTPIMETFVNEHPDFSYGGAKGIIALEGYEGALGFATENTKSKSYPAQLKEARAVVALLKASGWLFASHSYGHNSPSRRSLQQMKHDADSWEKEVGAVVGKTDIYIFPFGELIDRHDPKFKDLQHHGFRMFCGVQWNNAYLLFHKKSILMQRRNVDGYVLKIRGLSDIIDDRVIPSPVRPWYQAFLKKGTR